MWQVFKANKLPHPPRLLFNFANTMFIFVLLRPQPEYMLLNTYKQKYIINRLNQLSQSMPLPTPYKLNVIIVTRYKQTQH